MSSVWCCSFRAPRTVWRHRHDPHALRGVSRGTQYFILCNAATWAVYAAIVDAPWAAAPGLFNAPLAVFVLWMLRRQAPPTPQSVSVTEPDAAGARCPCGFDAVDEPHVLLCTSPPGFNTPRECDGVAPCPDFYIPVPRGVRLTPPAI